MSWLQDKAKARATGIHSNVVVNLTAAEAVGLDQLLHAYGIFEEDRHDISPEQARAIAKVGAAAERAKVPWVKR